MKIPKAILILSMLVGIAGAAWGEEPPAAEEGAQGIKAVFSGYGGEAIWTLVWFAVLLLVLWKFAWRPLLAGLQGREEHISRQISEAEKDPS